MSVSCVVCDTRTEQGHGRAQSNGGVSVRTDTSLAIMLRSRLPHTPQNGHTLPRSLILWWHQVPRLNSINLEGLSVGQAGAAAE